MASPAILKIDIIADATKAAAAFGKTSDAAQKTGGVFGKMGKAVGSALAVGAVVSFGKASFAAAEEAAQASDRLQAVYKSMGDETGKAAKEAEKYAATLGKQIAVDDDLIKVGQAQLATFSEVSNATARAAGIFDRATAAGADLAAAGFGSIESNAVQLGKALNDPIKGMSALAESGITFTDAQKAQITAMQASGDLLGAQKIVLKAVEGQVKGTVAATVTGSAKMAAAFGEVQEQVGAKLMPVMKAVTDLFVKYSDIILPVGAAIVGLVVAQKAWTVATQVWSAIQAVATGVQWAWNAAMFAGLAPLLLVIAAIAALIAIGVLIVKNWDTIKEAAAAVWAVMQDVWDKILGVVQSAFNWIKNNWPLLLAILTGPFGLAVLAVVKNFDAIKGAVMAVFNWIQDHWKLLLAILTGPIGIAVVLVVANFDTLKNAATAVYDWVKDKFEALAGIITGVLSGIRRAVSNVVDAIKDPLNAVIRAWNDFAIPRIEFSLPFGRSFGAGPFNFPNIPTLMHGGAVARTGLAVVHAGEMFSGVGGGFGGTTVVNHIHVATTGLGADAPSIQRAVANALRGYTSRNGPLDIPVRGVA